MRDGERECEWAAEEKGEANSVLSVELGRGGGAAVVVVGGVGMTTQRPLPELKSRVTRLAN